jgi:SAM-dependent methyltransferase
VCLPLSGQESYLLVENGDVGIIRRNIKAHPTLKRSADWLLSICSFCGFDPLRCARNLAGIPIYIRDAVSYSRRRPRHAFRILLRNCYPILNERTQSAGTLEGAYFHQDLWAARRIFHRRPEEHVDIGSRTDGFIAHLLAFMPVTVIDIRTMQSKVQGLTFIQDDATYLRHFENDSVDSISSLHAAEHFGLGRYSDPVDPDACFRFIDNLQRVLRPGGRLYFSVPIGRERLEFNAHRVFATSTILEQFAQLSLLSFSFVDDAGRLHEDCEPREDQSSECGCGLFEFTKARRDDTLT